jgi:hypothetical protein
MCDDDHGAEQYRWHDPSRQVKLMATKCIPLTKNSRFAVKTPKLNVSNYLTEITYLVVIHSIRILNATGNVFLVIIIGLLIGIYTVSIKDLRQECTPCADFFL